MQTSKSRWLAYTVLVGLIPILARLFIWLVTKEGSISPFSPQDFIAFGLVLHISNINEIEHLGDREAPWKATHNAISAVFIAIHGVLYCMTLIGGELVDESAISNCAGGIALTSLAISYTLFNRIGKVISSRQERSL